MVSLKVTTLKVNVLYKVRICLLKTRFRWRKHFQTVWDWFINLI